MKSPLDAPQGLRRSESPFRSPLKLLCAFLLGAATLPSAAFALNPARDLPQYNCVSWDRSGGLPDSGIHAITQTNDGYIWLGTESGLVRFDGVRFVQYSVPAGRAFHSEVISSLEPAAKGGLWFAVANGPLGYATSDGVVSPAPRIAWLQPHQQVTCLANSGDGALWVATGTGLGRYVESNPAASTFEPALPFLRWISEDNLHRQWLVSSDQSVRYRRNGTLLRFPDPSLQHEEVIAAVGDPNGRTWIGTASGLRCYDGAMKRIALPPFPHEVKVLLVDRHGVLWIGTAGAGLACFKGGKFQFLDRSGGLSDNFVTALFEDREGSLWVGTRGGLTQLSDAKFPIYSDAEGLIGGMCHGVFASVGGGLWAGFSQGLSFFDGQRAANYTVANSGLSYRYIKRIHEARDGDVYLLTGRKEIDIFSHGHVVAWFRCADWPTALAEDQHGMIVSVASRLFRVSRAGMVPYQFDPAHKATVTWIRDLLVTRDGALWLATVEGLVRVKDGQVRQWGTGEGLASDDVGSLCEDDDGTLWAGTTEGIVRMKDGVARAVTRQDGLLDDSIYGMVPDRAGSLWINASRGISRASLRELNAFCDGAVRRVTPTAFNGLSDVKTVDSLETEYVGCRTKDGRIWFPTPLGVLAITPNRIPIDPTAPPVRIENIRANGHDLPRSGPRVVSPGSGELEIRFAALSFVDPNAVQFRYQLKGFDRQWVKTRKLRRVSYTNLPPGRYVFHVEAANADGVWNTTGDSVELEFRPHFYQRAWFIALVALGGISAAAAALWRRLRRLKLEREAGERNRALLENEVAKRTAELQAQIAERQRAEAAVKASEGFLQSLLENLPVEVLRKDRDGRVTFANRRFCERYGVTPAAVIGRTAFDFLRREQAERQHQIEQEMVATGRASDGVETFTERDGRTTHNRVIKVPVYNDDRTIAGVQAIILDVTEQTRAEEKLAEASGVLHTMLQNTPDTIYFKDLQSRFVLVSMSKVRAALERVPELRDRRMAKGLARDVADEELLNGLTDFDIMTPADARLAYEDEQRMITSGEPIVSKLEKQLFLNGAERWHLTTKMPWLDPQNRVVGTFGISKDITNLKEAEQRLEVLNRQLRQASRQAGMAEIATGVLHNVGNVLNSVNVSATLIADQVRHTKAANVAKLAALLNDHAGNLGEFLTRDERGRVVPEYLASLAEMLQQEHGTLLGEIEQLQKNVEHIKEIVSMQQSYARTLGVTEPVSLPDIIEDALRMNSGSLARHDVDTVREYQARPVVTTDKHKVMQILINLVRNAKYACDESGRTDKRITVRTTAEGGRVRISVADNGVGIAAENLARIFAHGFTTREQGHGFGLHSCALAARELGGALSVHSDGPGTGATFVLELPYKANHVDDDSHGT